MTHPHNLEYLVLEGTPRELAERMNDSAKQGYLLLSSSTCAIEGHVHMTAVLCVNRNLNPVEPPTKRIDADGNVHDVQ